jgi:hypothetical protein
MQMCASFLICGIASGISALPEIFSTSFAFSQSPIDRTDPEPEEYSMQVSFEFFKIILILPSHLRQGLLSPVVSYPQVVKETISKQHLEQRDVNM